MLLVPDWLRGSRHEKTSFVRGANVRRREAKGNRYIYGKKTSIALPKNNSDTIPEVFGNNTRCFRMFPEVFGKEPEVFGSPR